MLTMITAIIMPSMQMTATSVILTNTTMARATPAIMAQSFI